MNPIFIRSRKAVNCILSFLFLLPSWYGCIGTIAPSSENAGTRFLDTLPLIALEENTDSIYFVQLKDSAFLKRGEIILAATYVMPLKMVGGSVENPQEQWDEAHFIANNLLIIRNISSAGHFCHVPSVDRVELYTSYGDTLFIKNDEKKSSSLSGFNITSNFNGNFFNSPTGRWGVITISSEGDLYGFLLIKDDGTVLEKEINNYSSGDDWDWSGENYLAEFDANDLLVFPMAGKTKNHEYITLWIDSTGNNWSALKDK